MIGLSTPLYASKLKRASVADLLFGAGFTVFDIDACKVRWI